MTKRASNCTHHPSPRTAAQRRDPGSMVGEGAKWMGGPRLKAGVTVQYEVTAVRGVGL
jgi:hypothetical protein